MSSDEKTPRFTGPGADYDLVQELYRASVESDNGGYPTDEMKDRYEDMLARNSAPVEDMPSIFDLPEGTEELVFRSRHPIM